MQSGSRVVRHILSTWLYRQIVACSVSVHHSNCITEEWHSVAIVFLRLNFPRRPVCIFTTSCPSCGTPRWQPPAHLSSASPTAVTCPKITVQLWDTSQASFHLWAPSRCLSCLGGKFTLEKYSFCHCIPEISFSPSSVCEWLWSPWHQRPATSGQSLRHERLHSVWAHTLPLYERPV